MRELDRLPTKIQRLIKFDPKPARDSPKQRRANSLTSC
jgi:hypothetical protein